MTSMDEVMMRMSASVMTTPVRPAIVVNMTMVGFCNVDKPLSLSDICFNFLHLLHKFLMLKAGTLTTNHTSLAERLKMVFDCKEEEAFWNDKISTTKTTKEDVCGMMQNFST